MAHERPRTAEQLAALPVGPAYGVQRYEITNIDRERGYVEINDRKINIGSGIKFIEIPVAPDLAAFFSESNDTIGWVDKDGAWILGRYADGRWFKKRG